MVFRIRHSTRFVYEAPAYESHNEIRLRPIDDPGQRVLAFDMRVTPRASIFEFRDYFGNRVYSLSIYPPHDRLEIVTTAMVERSPDFGGRPVEVAFDRFLAGDEARTRENCEFRAPAATFLSASGCASFSGWRGRAAPRTWAST